TLARDGAKLAYVAFDPTSFANELRVANADGTNPVALLPAHTFEAVDAPLFSPDGSTLLFSAVGEGPPPALSWLDQLLGVRVASAAPLAHNVPSDWWSIPATGGTPQRLTRLYETGLFGSFAPDGDYFAFLSLTGLYVMRPDGSGITSLLNLEAFGTMEWIR
ncbi:MAG: TolB family protein, partial [Anaerolineales bacterium]